MPVFTTAPPADLRESSRGGEVRPRRRDRYVDRSPVVVAAIAAVAVVLRLPYLLSPPSPDESGFLIVAQHWHAGGGSLYGPYWVDRPPLLLFLFRLGDALGGQVGVRLLGAAAVAVAVLFVGAAARRALGGRASVWAAAVAAAMLVSPLLGTLITDGELLATPFIAAGVYGATVALTAHDRRALTLGAALAGAAGTAAVLVKQNMFDVVVFAVAAVLDALRQRTLDARAGVRLVASAGLGGLASLGVVLGAAALRGTSPGGVFFAMYPFRVEAGRVLAQTGVDGKVARLSHLGEAALASLAPVVLVTVLVLVLTPSRRHARHPGVAWVAAGVLAMAAYATVSILAGGSYWTHYLIELVVPSALGAGLVSRVAGRRVRRLVLGAPVAAAAVAWVVGLGVSVDAPGQAAGEAISRVAHRDDTIVTLLGSPDTVAASRLDSPARYLWSLPTRTLDPDLAGLATLLSGPDAPAWVVVRGSDTIAFLHQHALGSVIDGRYRPDGTICGRLIFLRDDLVRAVPTGVGACTRPLLGWSPTNEGRLP